MNRSMVFYLLVLSLLPLVNGQCKLRFSDDDNMKILLSQVNKIGNLKFTSIKNNVKYDLKICNCPIEGKSINASIAQYQMINNDWVYYHNLGSHDSIEVIGGDNWYTIIYFDGDSYQDICQGTNRKSHLHIICDIQASKPLFNFLYEYKRMVDHHHGNSSVSDKFPSCGYVFELKIWDEKICVDHGHQKSKSGKRSTGSTLCILFFTIFSLYFGLGILYRKFMLGIGNGVQLIPNLDFWRYFLELQADGCQYFFKENPISKSAPEGGTRNDYSSFTTNIGGIPYTPQYTGDTFGKGIRDEPALTPTIPPYSSFSSQNIGDENLLR